MCFQSTEKKGYEYMIIENSPLVSVVIACYNHEQFVQDCIYSVINQTYQNIELIIIDDGSKDNSVAKIQEMVELCKQRFIRFEFRYRPNKGLTATLNEALNWCKGEYYCPFASDDIMISNRIYFQVQYLEKNKNCAGVFGAFEVIDQDGKVKNIRKKGNRKYYFKDVFLHKHELPAPTQLLKMNIINEVGGYDDGILIEDWYMWLKITELGYSLDSLDNLFVKYRSHDNNFSKKFDLMLAGRLNIIEIFKKNKFSDEAIAYAYLVAANEYLSLDFNKSWSMYLCFIDSKKKIFSIGSLKYISKVILKVLKW